MITRVRLKNWRSHLESELVFSKGTNALLGSMGSGKTSVLNAICFALFGSFPALQTKKLKLDEIIMKKPVEKNKAEVEVFFHADGKTYSVKRVIEKGKGTTYSEFREDGKLVEGPNSQRVTQLVEKTLKVNYELFSKAIYSEQNALDYFLTIPKGKRMKKIDQLLMIDKFEKARANSVTLSNRLVERKLGIQSVVEAIDVEELKKNIFELKNSLEKTRAEKFQLLQSLEKTSKERERMEKEVERIKEVKERMEKLKREESGVKSAIEETLGFLESMKEVKEQKKESVEKELEKTKGKIEKLEKELEEKEKNFQELSSLVAKSKARIEFLKAEKIEKIEKEVEEKKRIKHELEEYEKAMGKDLRKKLEERKELYEKIISEFEGLKVRIKNLEDAIEQLNSLEGKCPVCDSPLTEERRKILLEQKSKQVDAVKKRLEEVNEEKEERKKEIEELEESIEKTEEMELRIKGLEELEEELEGSKKLLEELEEKTEKAEKMLLTEKEEIGKIESELNEANEKKQKLEFLVLRIKEYEDKEKRLIELKEEKERIEKEIKELEEKISGIDFLALEKKLQELIAKEGEVRTRISSLEELVKEKEIRIEDYEKKLEEVTKQKEEIKRLERIIKDLKILGKALEETQVSLRSEFVEAVNYTMNKIWPTLYPYEDYTGISLAIEEGDYVLKLRERAGSFINVEGIASGGERSIACLALRVALALVLAPHVRILILDEPTANLDARGISELARTLKERIDEFIDQTFLITHIPELEDAVTGNAYRLERDKATDGVTRVIPLT